jgi:hypothetical protein
VAPADPWLAPPATLAVRSWRARCTITSAATITSRPTAIGHTTHNRAVVPSGGLSADLLDELRLRRVGLGVGRAAVPEGERGRHRRSADLSGRLDAATALRTEARVDRKRVPARRAQ